MQNVTIDELEVLYGTIDKVRYQLEDMWPGDLTEALASGDIQKLEEAWEKGWDVDMPLKSVYLAGIREGIENAWMFLNRKETLGKSIIEDASFGADAFEGLKYEILSQVVCAKVVFPVTWAIQHNCIESVKWLIRHGVQLDVKNYPSGECVDSENLHAALAAVKISKEMFRLLVENGAKVRDKTFDFFLFQSIDTDEIAVWVPFLLEHGADMEAAILTVKSAVYHSDIDRIERFLEIGFDINCQTKKGENFLKDTLLGHAAEYGTPETVRYLLSRGADATIRNAKGMTPYDLALQNHKLENAAILRDLCDPDGEGRRQAKEKLPQDIRDYLKNGGRRLMLGRDDIDYIDFLALDDVVLLSLARRKCVLLSKEVENYPTLWIVWNTTRKTVAYYDYEHEWYGEFKVSFTGFLTEIDQYLTGIFHGDYEQ